MNDEIKKILEHLKEYLQSKIDNNEHKIFYNDLMCDEKTIDCINAIDNVLNHITNLQEELHEIIDNADWWHNRFKAVQEQNKRLKEQINQYENPDDMTLFYMWLDVKAKDKMKQFENQIIMLKQQNQIITQLGEDYKYRCEKAIEYINCNKQKTICAYGDNEDDDFEICLCEEDIDNLLNILQNGSDKNDK